MKVPVLQCRLDGAFHTAHVAIAEVSALSLAALTLRQATWVRRPGVDASTLEPAGFVHHVPQRLTPNKTPYVIEQHAQVPLGDPR